jgi:hypothetical protein
MTTFTSHTTTAIRNYADREGITFDEAADRLVGYGLNAVNEHERILESLKPRPYRIESCKTYTDDDGEPALTDYTELFAAVTLDAARMYLCKFVEADADTAAAIAAAPIGHVLAISGSYYRITKTAAE